MGSTAYRLSLLTQIFCHNWDAPMSDYWMRPGADEHQLAADYIRAVIRTAGFTAAQMSTLAIMSVWKTGKKWRKGCLPLLGNATFICFVSFESSAALDVFSRQVLMQR